MVIHCRCNDYAAMTIKQLACLQPRQKSVAVKNTCVAGVAGRNRCRVVVLGTLQCIRPHWNSKGQVQRDKINRSSATHNCEQCLSGDERWNRKGGQAIAWFSARCLRPACWLAQGSRASSCWWPAAFSRPHAWPLVNRYAKLSSCRHCKVLDHKVALTI